MGPPNLEHMRNYIHQWSSTFLQDILYHTPTNEDRCLSFGRSIQDYTVLLNIQAAAEIYHEQERVADPLVNPL